MATNHTTNYQLNLWEPTDRFLREEFNENSQKLDAALKAEADARAAGDAALTQTMAQKADTSALNALAQTVAGKGNCTIVTGSYVGTGEYGEAHPIVLDFADTMGRVPSFLFIRAQTDTTFLLLCPGSAYGKADSNSTSSIALAHISWTDTGVSFYNDSNARNQLNLNNIVYSYIALF